MGAVRRATVGWGWGGGGVGCGGVLLRGSQSVLVISNLGQRSEKHSKRQRKGLTRLKMELLIRPPGV